MTLTGRPHLQDLGYFASLIDSAASGEKPVGLNAAEYLQHLDYHGITMLALQRGSLPDDVKSLLTARKALVVANEALKKNALIEMFDAFSQAGLDRIVLFKGGALAHTVYDQPWLRPRSDTDCLISHEQHAEFADVLFSLGYQKLFAIEGELISYQHTYCKQLAGQSVMNLDLHWRINNRQALAKAYHVDELLANSSRLDKVSSNIRIPAPDDSLLIASLHRLGHHAREERLSWLNDIHKLASSLDDSAWQRLCEHAQQKQLAAITADALNFAARLFNTQIPTIASQRLRAAAELNEPSQLFLNRDLPEWRYFVADIAAIPSLKRKLLFIRENIFPNPDYVRQQMGTRWASVAYVKRALRGILRLKKQQAN